MRKARNSHNTRTTPTSLTLNLERCTKLETLTILERSNLTTLNLEWCTNLKTLTIPEGSKITNLNLKRCTNLETLTISNDSEIANLYLDESAELSIHLSQEMSESEFWEDINEKYPNVKIVVTPDANISKYNASNLSQSSQGQGQLN